MKVEIHCHSHYSKGRKIPWEAFLSPDDIFRIAKEKGYGAVAITDHAVNTSWKEAKKAARKHEMIFIPGIEVASREGHVLALGLSDFVPSGLEICRQKLFLSEEMAREGAHEEVRKIQKPAMELPHDIRVQPRNLLQPL